MKCESRSQRWMGVVASMLVLTMLVAASPAQGPAEKPAESAAKVVKPRKQPRGRLPAYFSKVVSATQREQIYSIQAKYTEQIERLQEQLNKLVAQRDGDVEKVLTPEQRAEVAQMRSQRKSRTAAAKANKSPPAKPAGKG